MRALLDDAASGQAVVALIGGDAGVGKTRLVTEVTRLAAARGFTVLSGRCAELGESVPYLPMADALRGATRTPSAAPGLSDALASRPLLGRLLPESGTATASGGDGEGMARQQMLGAVLGLLAEVAAAGPVLLVFEDLHWADASTRARGRGPERTRRPGPPGARGRGREGGRGRGGRGPGAAAAGP